MADSLERLYRSVLAARSADPALCRTARLLRAGPARMALKLNEEAVELGLEALAGDRDRAIEESADLLYQLVVLWSELGIAPDAVWREMDWRERVFGMAGKVPKRRRVKADRSREPEAA